MNIFDRLFKKSVLAMAQKQGYSDNFVFYTLDNEYASHYPHVHICIKNDKKIKGKPLKNGSNLLSLGSIRLKPNDNYTLENLEFETIENPIITSAKNKVLFINWLLQENPRFRVKNCFKCVSDYSDSNENFRDYTKYMKYLGEV